jgi:hypothetical protein
MMARDLPLLVRALRLIGENGQSNGSGRSLDVR